MMETYSGSAVVIKQDLIQSLELPSFNDFLQALDKFDTELYEYAACIEDFHEVDHLAEEEQEELDELFHKFRLAFTARTSIDIFLSYHDSESPNDEVEGAFFYLKFDDVFQPTPAALNLQVGGLELRLSHFSGSY